MPLNLFKTIMIRVIVPKGQFCQQEQYTDSTCDYLVCHDKHFSCSLTREDLESMNGDVLKHNRCLIAE